ncbi:MAG: DUF362 domain-containing protein [Candidatus Omnitrophota bacterium]
MENSACSEVSLVRCKSYSRDEVGASVRKALDLIGGLGSFIKKGERVLLKPNILSPSEPDKGIDTHPEVVRAVALLVKEAGAIPVVGDSPGGYHLNFIENVYAKSGIKAVCDEEGIELVKFDKAVLVENKGPSASCGLKHIPIAKEALRADKIISLPKMKTHSLTVLTGAVKNMFGAVVGLHKVECHKMAPNADDFAKILIDVYGAVRPHLAVMDGVVAMEGFGPATGGTLKDMGLILASPDAVALDSVFARIAGAAPESLKTLSLAQKRGLGRIRDVEIKGESLDSIPSGFELPGVDLSAKLPSFISRPIARFIKFYPYIDRVKCVKCRMCAKSCPASAITIDDKISGIDYKKCISCMCCSEVCAYNAVFIKRGLLTKLLKMVKDVRYDQDN